MDDEVPRAAPGVTEDTSRSALRTLAAEIAVGDYRDAKGHHLVHNTAYLEALAVLELEDLLERRA